MRERKKGRIYMWVRVWCEQEAGVNSVIEKRKSKRDFLLFNLGVKDKGFL